MVNSTFLGLKKSQNHVKHKIEGFCDQSIVNSIHHHIIILKKKMITKAPLYASLITLFLTFEFPKMVNSTCLWLKNTKKCFQHKIEGFYDQSTRNNVLHHILILLQNMITMVTLDVWLTIHFLTFEQQKKAEDNWQQTKQWGYHHFCLDVSARWYHRWSYSTGQQGTICPIAQKRDV